MIYNHHSYTTLPLLWWVRITSLHNALLNHPPTPQGIVKSLHSVVHAWLCHPTPQSSPPPHSTMHCWSITLLHNALLKHHPTPQSIVKAPPHSTMHCWSITPLQNALATHHPTSQCIVEAPPHFTMHCWSITPLHNADVEATPLSSPQGFVEGPHICVVLLGHCPTPQNVVQSKH